MYIMLSGSPPFYHEDNFELFEIIASGQYDFADPTWKDVSAEAQDLIKKLLVVDPEKRLSSDEIKGHAWMSGDFEPPTQQLSNALGSLKRWDTERKTAKEQ
jgi:serine/threonine protein kinase